MWFPKMLVRMAYLQLNKATNRNALSIEVLRSLREQLVRYNTPPGKPRPLFLPELSPRSLMGNAAMRKD
ncbi:hypothetical protein F4859DRAFT_472297, partial [Xylaria cf. heliscus]